MVILPADKGNSTVIMNKSEYTKKIHDIIVDTGFKTLKKDPTKKLERTIIIDSTLKELLRNGEFNEELKKRITP